ncbi:MAG: hypothetical protein EOP16_01645 [Pseudonocardia sp.]|nr:MAG: hypothetical protein EOP16_01645 [Pseudonocardia sp.]
MSSAVAAHGRHRAVGVDVACESGEVGIAVGVVQAQPDLGGGSAHFVAAEVGDGGVVVAGFGDGHGDFRG